jgi:hypothetical protein
MHDDYKQLDLSQLATAPPNGRVLEPCPICASEAQLWQYSESETAPRKLLVMCSHGDRIGPQDGLVDEGCPFYMPKDGHYRETIRDAVRYWNELAKAIAALRGSAVPSGVKKLLEGRNSQHVLKAEGASPDATDRENCANTSPDGGPMGAGQAAAAAPTGGVDPTRADLSQAGA